MRKNTITFDNGNHAVVVIAGRDTDAQTILKSLDIAQPHALIMVFGGAKGLDDSRKARLAELFTDAIAPAAAEVGCARYRRRHSVWRDGDDGRSSRARRPRVSVAWNRAGWKSHLPRGSERCEHRRWRAARTESLPFRFGGRR